MIETKIDPVQLASFKSTISKKLKAEGKEENVENVLDAIMSIDSFGLYKIIGVAKRVKSSK